MHQNITQSMFNLQNRPPLNHFAPTAVAARLRNCHLCGFATATLAFTALLPMLARGNIGHYYETIG